MLLWLFAALLSVHSAIAEPARTPAGDGSAWDAPLSDRRSVNVKIYPLPWLIRVFSFDVDIGAWRSVTLGPSLMSIKLHDARQQIEAQMGLLGLRTNFYLGSGGRFSDSWFLSPLLSGGDIKLSGIVVASGEAIDVSASVKASLAGLFFGYQWFWGSGVNVSLGVGILAFAVRPEVTLSGKSQTTGQTAELPVDLPNGAHGTLPWVEFGLGWVF